MVQNVNKFRLADDELLIKLLAFDIGSQDAFPCPTYKMLVFKKITTQLKKKN